MTSFRTNDRVGWSPECHARNPHLPRSYGAGPFTVESVEGRLNLPPILTLRRLDGTLVKRGEKPSGISADWFVRA